MIENAELEYILRFATDISVVAEIYSADTVPTADGFDPEDALFCYARVSGITFRGVEYTRLVKKYGNIKRTITPETNNASIDFSNVSREIAAFELTDGFEGKIKVIRLLSRSLSIELSDTQILFSGRCEKPKSGNKESLSVTSNFILGSLDAEIPRRKYAATDDAGRVSSDKLFEGFLFIPQYGTTTYSVREKRGGILGFLGFKKSVTKTLSYSSFSDLDANKDVAEAFGRVQMSGVHIGYVDTGPQIRMNVSFCEGEMADFLNTRSTNTKLPLSPTSYAERRGEPGGTGDQDIDPLWVAPGYYSRTAYIRCQADNSEVSNVEAAPEVVAVVLGRIVITPNPTTGVWEIENWSDNAAAILRFILTSDNYYKLHENWIDDDSFLEAHNFNDEILFDNALSDFLFVPDTGSFSDLMDGSLGNNYLLPTSSVTPAYLKWLKNEAFFLDAFGQGARSFEYDNTSGLTPIEPPIDPDDPPPGGTSTNNLTYFLRRRYTCNFLVDQKMRVMDLIHQVIFPSSRLFFTQGSNGKIKLGHKKPVDWALGTEAFEVGNTLIILDDVSPWIDNLRGHLLIDPNTTESEVRDVLEANYDLAQNGVTLTASAHITVTGFAGCDGANTPGSATLVIDDPDEGNESSVTLAGIEFIFITTAEDTVQTVAAFIYASINAHPQLKRRFVATYEDDTVTIKGKFGTLLLDNLLEFDHAAPVTSPAAAPVITDGAGGSLLAGDYRVAYAFRNSHGQTFISPFDTITLSNDRKIVVGAIIPPAGCDVVWYSSPAAGSARLRYHSSNDGSSFEIDSLPLLTAPLPPDMNRTGTEVLRVMAVFSDREETRSNVLRSNVIKASYDWILGNREKTVNEIEIGFRDATQDFRLVKFKLRDPVHIAKTKKKSPVEINGQAIDSYNQAYRIASGELAEKRDADFFYKWSATREALLLEEGDVCAITDDGSGVYNLAVRIETLDLDANKELPKVSFTARKYSTTLYDDSVAERQIPVIVENENSPRPSDYAITNATALRAFDANNVSINELADVVATLVDDLDL